MLFWLLDCLRGSVLTMLLTALLDFRDRSGAIFLVCLCTKCIAKATQNATFHCIVCSHLKPAIQPALPHIC